MRQYVPCLKKYLLVSSEIIIAITFGNSSLIIMCVDVYMSDLLFCFELMFYRTAYCYDIVPFCKINIYPIQRAKKIPV